MSIPENEQRPYTAPGASQAYEPVAGDPASGGYVPPPPPPGGYGAGYPGGGFAPGPGMPHGPNPMLAGLLGFIPGVGAMYNGQFAKGLAHIAIFAVFTSLANHVNGIFGLFVAGWVFYMAFEAYQTARARREGLPLPDPFGLNNVGERFGFKGNPDFTDFWGTGGPSPNATVASETRIDPDGGFYRTRVDASGRQSTFEVDPSGNVYRSSGYGAAPSGGATGSVPPPPGYVPPMPSPGSGPYGYGSAPYGAPPTYGMPPVPPPPYGVPPMPPMPPMPVPRGGLPTGAIWLIGLGFFALLGSLHPFAFLEGEATGGLFLIGLAIFIFWRRHTASGYAFADGSPAAKWSMIRAMRGAGVVFVVGLLTFLQGLHVIRWEASWPFLLIFIGVAILAERAALSKMVSSGFTPQGYPVGPPPAAASEPVAETSSPTSIVPKYTRPSNDLGDEEGR